MPTDWFRNERWSVEIERHFYKKLNRSRSQRAQYLRIQAYSLAKSEPLVALRLIDEYFATGDTSLVAAAYSDRAMALETLGLIPDAIESHRRSIDWSATHPGHQTVSRLHLPFLIATSGQQEHYDMAIQLLQSPDLKLVFPVEMFLYSTTLAIIFSERGQASSALKFAESALQAAGSRESMLPRHPKLGLVGDRFPNELKRMERLVKAKGQQEPGQGGWIAKLGLKRTHS
jgi:tetratricopeptide (TPR) repeat protein